ncbi:MAG: AAA family ATPase [Actinomycetota bacterium]|nr:AAA family ATPase [Actinomycetota bacterium]
MSPDLLAPFVGRAEELAVLADALDAAGADQFVPILIGGEAGVGKTRLVREFVATLPDGVAAHWGRCMEDGGAAPFSPWAQVLRSLTGTERAVTEGIEEDRFVGFERVAALLREYATRPMVVVLDDLHVADIGSLELMRFLVRAVADVPVLLIGTHRDHELRADTLRDIILGDVARFGRRLSPPRLDRDEVAALLEGIAGQAVPSAVIDAVLDRTAGNALFVDETARVLVSTGFGSVDVMPDGVRAAVRARLRDMSPAGREALTAASVLGARADWSVLATMLDLLPSELADRLGPAIALGVIGAPSDGHVEFSHSLVRHAIYDDLSPTARATWHQSAAETLLTLYRSRPDPHAAAIAQHYADASLVTGAKLAADWASHAARVARTMRGHEAAAAWSDRAATLFAGLGEGGRAAEELACAADDLGAVGNNDGSSKRAREVSEFARRTGSGELLTRAARCRAAVFGPSREREAPALLREALAHPSNAAPSRSRAELLGLLASLLGVPGADGRSPDPRGARAARAEIEQLVATGVDARDLVLESLLSTEHGPGCFAQRQRWLQEYTEVGRASLDQLGWRIKQSYWAASVAFEGGRLGDLRRELDDWGHVAEVLGVRYWDWRLALARASQAFAHGRLAEAEDRARASLATAGEIYQELTTRVVGGIVIAVRHEQGRMAELIGGWPTEDLGPVAIILHVERDEPAVVRSLVAEQRAQAERSERDIYWLAQMTFIARGAVFLHDRATCHWVVDELVPFADQFVMFGRCALFGGPVAEVVGVAAAEAGRPDLAEQHLRQALTWAETERAPGFATRARLGLASVLDDGRPARRNEREQLLRQVVEVGSRLGMAGFVAQAERSLDGSAMMFDLDHPPVDHQPSGPAVRTFGAFSVTPNGADEPVRWSSKKARDTLKFLVTRRGAAVSREELIEMLWPGIDLPRGRNRLSVILTMVRSALDPDRRWPVDQFLRADRDVVALRTERLDIDLDRFSDLAAEGLRRLCAGDTAGKVMLEEAVELAKGGFLVEDIYADWPAATRADLAATHAAVLQALADEARGVGDHDALVLRLSQLVDRDPYGDPAHAALVDALTAAGRHEDAKRQQDLHLARLADLHLTEPA